MVEIDSTPIHQPKADNTSTRSTFPALNAGQEQTTISAHHFTNSESSGKAYAIDGAPPDRMNKARAVWKEYLKELVIPNNASNVLRH
jgi:hypothetical protein